MRRGIAVSTTMFMLLVMYFLATLIVWQAHANLGFTRLNSEQTRRTLAAQGMINEFIANMTRDPNYEPNHGPDRPVVARDRGVEYRTWAVPDRQYGSVVHVICRARGVGAAGTQVSRIVRKKPNIANVLYSDVNSSGVPDIRCFTTDTGRWVPVPTPQKNFFVRLTRPTRVVLSRNWSPVESLSGYCAVNGNLYAVYIAPDSDGDGFSDGLPTLMTFDRRSRSWDYELMPEEFDPASDTLMTSSAGRLYVADQEGILFQPASGAAWSRLPAPPGYPANVVPNNMSAGGSSLYAHFTSPSGGEQLYCWNGSNWTRVGLPPADHFTRDGELVPGGNRTVVPDQLAVSPEGVLYGLWQRPGVDTLFRFTPPGLGGDPPPGWSATLPLRHGDGRRPLVEDVESIKSAEGALVNRVTRSGKPDEIFLRGALLPAIQDGVSVRQSSPVVAAGAFATGRVDYDPGSFY